MQIDTNKIECSDENRPLFTRCGQSFVQRSEVALFLSVGKSLVSVTQAGNFISITTFELYVPQLFDISE